MPRFQRVDRDGREVATHTVAEGSWVDDSSAPGDRVSNGETFVRVIEVALTLSVGEFEGILVVEPTEA